MTATPVLRAEMPPAAARAALTVVPYYGGGSEWDAFVASQREASFTHLSAWRSILRDALGHETLSLVAYDAGGDWAGVLPLAWVRSALFGKYLVSIPFLNSGGPIGTPAARVALSEAARDEAQRRGADLLELRCRVPCEALARSDRKIAVRLPLPGTADALMKGFPAKLRSQIRRPMKAGLTVRFGADQRHAFYDVYAEHMRDLGSPALGENVFDALSNVFPDHITFAVVYRGKAPVAGGCGFGWRDEFELVWASALRAESAVAPNMLLYWALMERAIEQGRRTFDFGRCTAGSGTHKFKVQWGGIDVPLPWTQWSARGQSAPPTPDQGRYRSAVAIWRRLPAAVTRVCGPPLARLIP